MKALSKKTDHELIHLFQDGNLDALESLVLRHKDKLYTSILFLVKDKYLAEDIFQDVFIRIFDRRRSYDPAQRFSTWLWRIALNLCYDELRRVQRRHELISELRFRKQQAKARKIERKRSRGPSMTPA